MSKKKVTNKQEIELNRAHIDDLMHHSANNIDSINMLRYQITSVEPMILFKPEQEVISSRQRKNFVDYTNIKNIGLAYDYILEHKDTKIDTLEIKYIHDILVKDTENTSGFRYCMTKVLGEYAPKPEKIYYLLEQIQYHLTEENYSVLTRAFDLHYDIIMAQPFDDLNKRTARLIMNWFLIQKGYRPIIFNKKTDSVEYMDALRNKLEGNHRAYTEYMEKCMIRTQREIIALLKAR